MSQKTKTILGILGFAALLIGALLAYNALSNRVKISVNPPPQGQQGQQTQESKQPKAGPRFHCDR